MDRVTDASLCLHGLSATYYLGQSHEPRNWSQATGGILQADNRVWTVDGALGSLLRSLVLAARHDDHRDNCATQNLLELLALPEAETGLWSCSEPQVGEAVNEWNGTASSQDRATWQPGQGSGYICV